jgi:hypothetical protein
VRAHVLRGAARGEEYAADIDADDVAVLLVGGVGDRRAAEHRPGVVDEDIEPAEPLAGLIDETGGDDFIGHVALEDGDFAAGGPDRIGYRIGAVAVAVAVDDEANAERAETHRDRRSNAGTGAYDEAVLAFQIRRHVPPPSLYVVRKLTRRTEVVKLHLGDRRPVVALRST